MRVTKTLRTLRGHETRLRSMPLDCPPGMRCSTAGARRAGSWDGTRWAALTAELATITQSALAASGHRGIMAPPFNSCILARHIPDAQLISYPGSGHGFLFQYPSLFAAHAARFPGTDAAIAGTCRAQAKPHRPAAAAAGRKGAEHE
jgi:pimeloyl-ACP methyl ester carboxylesterase